MRVFFRLLASDLRYGLVAAVPRFAIVALAAFLVYLLSYVVVLVKAPAAAGLTLGEGLLCVWRGMLPYAPESGVPFQFPMAWFAFLLAAAYVAADYPVRDFEGMGARLMVVARSRWAWWLAKCGWVASVALVCWALPFALAAVVTLASGGDWTLCVRPGVAVALSAGRSQAISEAASAMAADASDAAAIGAAALDVGPALAAAACTLVAIMLVQTLVSLAVHPVVGMATTVGVLFFSAYFRLWWLPGEYLMLARTDALMRAGMDPLRGALLALGVGLAAVLAGGLIVRGKDIMGRGGDAR